MSDSTPWDHGAVERMLLAFVIENRAMFWQMQTEGVEARHFIEPPHQKLWEVMARLDREDREWGVQILIIEGGGELAGLLMEIADQVPISTNARWYALRVIQGAWQRQASEEVGRLRSAIVSWDPRTDIGPLQAQVASTLESLTKTIIPGRHKTEEPKELADRMAEEYEAEVLEQIEGRINGVKTGFPAIDAKLGGFINTGLYLIGARPAVGKTTFASNCAINAAYGGKNALFFTMEMKATQVLRRMMASEARVNSKAIIKACMAVDEVTRFTYALLAYEKSGKLRINDKVARNYEIFELETRRLHRLGLVDIVFLDYIQQMRIRDINFRSRIDEVTEISSRLKDLATDLNIPIVALAQLSRASTKDSTPNLTHLADSSSLEKDSDGVLLLHRPSMDHDPNSPNDPEPDQVIIRKNRHGDMGTIYMNSDMAYGRFSVIEGQAK